MLQVVLNCYFQNTKNRHIYINLEAKNSCYL